MNIKNPAQAKLERGTLRLLQRRHPESACLVAGDLWKILSSPLNTPFYPNLLIQLTI
jgi:hypothetical protein